MESMACILCLFYSSASLWGINKSHSVNIRNKSINFIKHYGQLFIMSLRKKYILLKTNWSGC